MAKVMKSDRKKIRGDIDASKGGRRFFRLPEGKTYLRVLPGIEGKADKSTYYGRAMRHTLGSGSSFQHFRCLEDFGQWCPFCAASRIFSEEDEDRSGNLRPRARYFLNVLVRGKEGIQLMEAPNAVIDLFEDIDEDEWGSVDDPENGFWVAVTRKGKGNTMYKSATPIPKNRGPLPSWVDLDDCYNLTAKNLLPLRKAKELVAILVEYYGDVVDDLEVLLKRDLKSWKRKRKQGEEE